MPIDPNIIGNVMVPQAPQLPDVNAMMQTRTRGLENIYKTETARQEQAKEEAAAQAAAQEDALVKALLPAYTYGIETGDMAGALNLVPPEMQESIAPYVQALEGKPPEQVRSALIGSLSASKAGQEALAAMQRAATIGVQQGQLDVSRQRLAQETAAGSKVAQWITDDAGNVTGLDAQGNVVATQPGIGKKTAVVRETPDGVRLKPGEIYNEETGRVEAVKGSETYNKQKAKQSTDYAAANNALRELEKVKSAVSDVKNTTGYQKASNTGTLMANMPNVPLASSWSGAYDFQTKYKNLKGSVATLGRAAASLQGKLGNMAVQEWKLVSDAIANLDLENMDADVLDGQLDIIANDILSLEAQVRDAYEQEYGGSQFYAPLTGGNEGQPSPRGAPNDVDDPLGIR